MSLRDFETYLNSFPWIECVALLKFGDIMNLCATTQAGRYVRCGVYHHLVNWQRGVAGDYGGEGMAITIQIAVKKLLCARYHEL